jgi:hypothetical protein
MTNSQTIPKPGVYDKTETQTAQIVIDAAFVEVLFSMVRKATQTPVEGVAVLVATLRVLKENYLTDVPNEHFILFIKDLLEGEVKIPGREIQ